MTRHLAARNDRAVCRPAPRTCPNCHNTTRWTRVRQYKQFLLFFVPIARWKRRQLEVCGICGTTVAV